MEDGVSQYAGYDWLAHWEWWQYICWPMGLQWLQCWIGQLIEDGVGQHGVIAGQSIRYGDNIYVGQSVYNGYNLFIGQRWVAGLEWGIVKLAGQYNMGLSHSKVWSPMSKSGFPMVRKRISENTVLRCQLYLSNSAKQSWSNVRTLRWSGIPSHCQMIFNASW